MALKTRTVLLTGGGLALVAGLSFVAFGEDPVPVDLATVTQGQFEITINADGQTRVRDLYEVAAPISGTAMRSPVDVGDRVIADETIATGHYVTGANREGVHLTGAVLGRDFDAETADIREVLEGELSVVDGQPLLLEKVIEVGNIFKLGTRYSEALGATYLDEDGKEHPVIMGSYGIGPARIAAAAIEQMNDEAGIISVAEKILTSLGYRVTSFFGSLEALERFRSSPDDFDLVVTDQTMPHRPG